MIKFPTADDIMKLSPTVEQCKISQIKRYIECGSCTAFISSVPIWNEEKLRKANTHDLQLIYGILNP